VGAVAPLCPSVALLLTDVAIADYAAVRSCHTTATGLLVTFRFVDAVLPHGMERLVYWGSVHRS